MKLEIEVRHTGRGIAEGTLPWLLKNIGYIEVGRTKLANQAAWLNDKDGKVITILAMRNAQDWDADGDPDGPISRVVERRTDDSYNLGPEANRHFTPAAFRLIGQLAEAASAEMERATAELDALAGGDLIVVEAKRSSDDTARDLAAACLEQPALVPILSDRLNQYQDKLAELP